MAPRQKLPDASLTYDARTTLARMTLSNDNINTTSMNENNGVTASPVIPDSQSTTLNADTTPPDHSPTSSPTRSQPSPSPTSSETVAASSQNSSDTLAAPNPKISIREYILWKASGISPYSAYIAWKQDNIEDVDLASMVKLRDMPHIREREEKAMRNVQEGSEREKMMEGKIRDRDGLWGTQFV